MMPDEACVVRVLPDTQERTARVLAAVMLMEPDRDRLAREYERLVERYGQSNALAIWRRAFELKTERS